MHGLLSGFGGVDLAFNWPVVSVAASSVFHSGGSFLA